MLTIQGLQPADTLYKHWDSFEAFVEQVKKPGQSSRNKSVTLDFEFTQTHTFDEAVALAERGWSEGLEKMESLRGSLRKLEPQMAERHVGEFSESGDDVDIGRFVTGEPECMVNYSVQFVPAAGRVIKLVYNLGASSAVSPKSMMLRGACAVMLSDLIEQSGLRVEILAVSAVTQDPYENAAGCFSILAKAASQPLELDRLAFILAHPSTLRRLMLRAREQNTDAVFSKHFGETYGFPAKAIDQSEGVIHVDPLQYGFGNQINSDADAVAFTNKMLDSILEKQP